MVLHAPQLRVLFLICLRGSGFTRTFDFAARYVYAHAPGLRARFAFTLVDLRLLVCCGYVTAVYLCPHFDYVGYWTRLRLRRFITTVVDFAFDFTFDLLFVILRGCGALVTLPRLLGALFDCFVITRTLICRITRVTRC